MSNTDTLTRVIENLKAGDFSEANDWAEGVEPSTTPETVELVGAIKAFLFATDVVWEVDIDENGDMVGWPHLARLAR